MIQFKSNACYFSPICPLVFFLLFLIFCLLLEYGNIFLLFHFSSLFHFQLYILTQFFLSGCPRDLAGKESTCNAGDTGDAGSIPGSGRSPGGGNGNPLQYSCLKNLTHRGVWQARIHGVAKSRTQLSTHALFQTCMKFFIMLIEGHTYTHIRVCVCIYLYFYLMLVTGAFSTWDTISPIFKI